MRMVQLITTLIFVGATLQPTRADDAKTTQLYRRIKASSNRIMWGADTVDAEVIYGATEFTRQCLAEALAEKVVRGELS